MEVIDNITINNEGQDKLRPADDSSSIGLRLAALEETVNGLRELFNERIMYDEAKEQAFNVLYEKLRHSEADNQSALKKGLILSLLLLHDRMQKAEGEFAETAAGQRIGHLRRELLDILYAEGVELIDTQSDGFDRRLQEALQAVPTTDPEKDNTVDRVVREGFLSSGKVMRPQSVIVRRYNAVVS
jgi:molecular chaperone GrpE (heat shock protein)